MDRASDELLAGAGFTADQNGGTPRSDLGQLMDSVLVLRVDRAKHDRRVGLGGEVAIDGAIGPALLLAKHQQGAAGLDQVPVGQGADTRRFAVDEDAVLGAEVGNFPAVGLTTHGEVHTRDLLVRGRKRGGRTLACEAALLVSTHGNFLEVAERDP